MRTKRLFKKHKALILVSLLSLSFFTLFVKLSIWQYQRGLEKAYILKNISNISQIDSNKLRNNKNINMLDEYSLVKLNGYFKFEDTILLGNQNYNHTPGYHVITPFIINGQKNNKYIHAVLVDRGFISNKKINQTALRNLTSGSSSINDIYPNPVNQPQDVIKLLKNENYKQIQITGITKNSNTNQFILGENIINDKNLSFTLIQKLDLTDQKLLSLFKYEISNKYLRLLNPSDYGFVLDWQWTNIPPEKHKAYSFQWLTLAITVVLLYSYFCFKSIKK